jgi:hypothetical protein
MRVLRGTELANGVTRPRQPIVGPSEELPCERLCGLLPNSRLASHAGDLISSLLNSGVPLYSSRENRELFCRSSLGPKFHEEHYPSVPKQRYFLRLVP